MKKFSHFLVGMFVAVASVGFADSAGDQKSKDQKPKEPMCDQPVWTKLNDAIGVSIAADFLYWQASQTGMQYGQITDYIDTTPVPGSGGAAFFGDYKNIHFKFDPGVRVLLGFKPRHDDWEIDFVWTHLNTKASGFSGLPNVFNEAIFIPNYNFIVPQFEGTNGVNASAHWSAWYNTLDLDFSKGLPFLTCFGLKAHMGLRNLWLNQRYNIISYNLNSGGATPANVYVARAKMVENIWGIGPMIGLDSLWKIYRGLSLFGKATFSLIWSHVSSTDVGDVIGRNQAPIDPPIVVSSAKASFHTTVPEISLMVGGEYDMNFSDDRYHAAIRLGWEFNNLFNTNFLGASYQSFGDFSTSGLTAGFVFDF